MMSSFHPWRLLLLMVFLFNHAPAWAQGDCVEAASPRPKVNINNGLPTLGAMVMAAGAGVGLFALTAAVTGTAWARERVVTQGWTPVWPWLAVASGVGALTTVAAFTLVLGGFIWFVAWLPPPISTTARCP